MTLVQLKTDSLEFALVIMTKKSRSCIKVRRSLRDAVLNNSRWKHSKPKLTNRLIFGSIYSCGFALTELCCHIPVFFIKSLSCQSVPDLLSYFI